MKRLHTDALLRFVPIQPIARADAPADPETKPGEYRNPNGLFWVTASTEGIASDGHRIAASGWMFDRFDENPIMPWAHTAWPGLCGGRSGAPMHPIGNVPGRRINEEAKTLECGLNFYEQREGEGGPYLYPLAHLTAAQFRDGMLKMVSVGFEMVERTPLAELDPTGAWAHYRDEESHGYLSTKTMLFELSPVPIGADPGALAIGSSESRIGTFARAWMDTDDGRAFIRDSFGAELRASITAELDRLAADGKIRVVGSVEELEVGTGNCDECGGIEAVFGAKIAPTH